MNLWKRIYVITALCMIAAGIIYLMLPLSQKEETEKSQQGDLNSEPAELLGNVLYRIGDGWIETSKGRYSLAQDVQWTALGRPILEGKGCFLGENIELTKDDEGKVIKVEAKRDLSFPQRVRVVLAEDASMQDYVHEKIAVSCDEAFWSIRDGVVCAHPPETEIEGQDLGYRTIFYTARDSDALTLITAKGTRVYKGQLEITAQENEGYVIVNEVPLETYLKGVVPSEMPGSYGEEAAKVQAVCARSYAYRQWSCSEKFVEWGAQLDDSSRSQVYGGAIEHEVSTKGVEVTWGQVLTYNDQPIATHYFSTSCGYTANGDEVWGDTRQAYETGVPQYTEGEYGNLAEEEEFHAFITDDSVLAYDRESPWFRWSVSIDLQILQKMIDDYFIKPQIVKVVKDRTMEDDQVSEIGKLQDIFVYERSETGMVKAMILVGSDKTVVLESPMEIRSLLGGVSVCLANGDASGQRELLPSAFFSLEKIKDTEETLVSITICGGGYGHGVGMSQNGVKGMTEAGYSYDQILNHYFPDTELTALSAI